MELQLWLPFITKTVHIQAFNQEYLFLYRRHLQFEICFQNSLRKKSPPLAYEKSFNLHSKVIVNIIVIMCIKAEFCISNGFYNIVKILKKKPFLTDCISKTLRLHARIIFLEWTKESQPLFSDTCFETACIKRSFNTSDSFKTTCFTNHCSFILFV